ncbi:uncharacterized protein LOC130627642 [Hydractinia symbiolongicarpus]|uniref:uncharacterized protein LOC130627642 n=1 Tax=Hydractinia symbiolongicarpus TaxID=13093 RepID=UPI00254D02D3|nr:uncharacterized protein LOC130627642 [Hydractinia symbiolongicarpus]
MIVFIMLLQHAITDHKVQNIGATIKENHKLLPNDLSIERICRKIYGKIAIVSAVTAGNYVRDTVNSAVQSVRCYAKLKRYDLLLIQEEKDGTYTGLNGWTIPKQCLQKDVSLAKKRRFVAQLLYYYDYIVHLDADTGVVNARHCFEEYITPGIDVFLLERIHSGEIQSGNYIVKNSTYARNFLMDSYRRMVDPKKVENAELVFEFHSRVVNKAGIIKCQQNYTYYNYVRCVKRTMNGQMVFENFKVYRRADGFVRDAWASNFFWSEKDFLLHAIKYKDDVLFTKTISSVDCSNSTWLPVKTSLFANLNLMKSIWKIFDKGVPNYKFGIEHADIADCWPYCPENITQPLR